MHVRARAPEVRELPGAAEARVVWLREEGSAQHECCWPCVCVRRQLARVSRLRKALEFGDGSPPGRGSKAAPKLRARGWRGGGGAESRARTCACGATRVRAPRGVVIPLEWNHGPHVPPRGLPRLCGRERSGLPGPETGAARPCPGPISAASGRSPSSIANFQLLPAIPLGKRRGPQKGRRREGGGKGSTMLRLGFTQEPASVNSCEVGERSTGHKRVGFQKKQGSQKRPPTLSLLGGPGVFEDSPHWCLWPGRFDAKSLFGGCERVQGVAALLVIPSRAHQCVLSWAQREQLGASEVAAW